MSSKWIVRVAVTLAVLAVGALVLTLSAEAQSVGPAAQSSEAIAAQTGPDLTRNITVVGEGRVRMKPDIAQTNIGVEVVAESIKEASSQVQETMNNVIKVLTEQGVEEKDIQTAGYNVWVERPYGPEGPQPEAKPLYHVSNNVSVTVRNLDNLGTILDAAIEAGANNIFGVNFSVADPSSFQSQAREEAVANARSKAEELAKLNNVEVGQLISVSEVIGGSNPLFFSGVRSAVAEGLGGGGGPIAPGELELTVQLQVTYALQ
jgi:uncharacterized protein YggE